MVKQKPIGPLRYDMNKFLRDFELMYSSREFPNFPTPAEHREYWSNPENLSRIIFRSTEEFEEER